MPVVTTQPTYPVLNNVPLATKGWLAFELAAVFDNLPLVGEDRQVPGDDGLITYPRSVGAGVRSWPIWIFGDFDQDGDPYSDVATGIRTNKNYLRDNLGYGSQSGDGTVPFVIHWADGDEEATDVVNLGFSGFATVGEHVLGRLDLLFPHGDLVAVGS